MQLLAEVPQGLAQVRDQRFLLLASCTGSVLDHVPEVEVETVRLDEVDDLDLAAVVRRVEDVFTTVGRMGR